MVSVMTLKTSDLLLQQPQQTQQRHFELFFCFFLHKHVLFISMSTLLSWAYLEVTTSSRYNDSLQAYAAGAVEAAVTSQVSIIPLRNLRFRVNSV